MSYTRIPPRQDFGDVSDQVFEWLRALATSIQQNDDGSADAQFSIITGFLSDIELEIDAVKNENDTTQLLSAKISELESKIDSLQESNELALYKAFEEQEVASSVLKSLEFRGPFTIPSGSSGILATLTCPTGKRIRLVTLYTRNTASNVIDLNVGLTTYLNGVIVGRQSRGVPGVLIDGTGGSGNDDFTSTTIMGAINEGMIISSVAVTTGDMTYAYEVLEDA